MANFILYNRPGSGGFAVEAALTLAGQAYEYIDVGTQPGEDMPDTFRTINPWGQVPTLILPDGAVMTETGAILTWLAGAHPAARLCPQPWTTAHAAFLRWMTFLSANIYEGILRRGYPTRFTDDPNGLAAVRSAADQRTHDAFAVLEQDLGDKTYLLGDLSVADIYLAMLFAWHGPRPDLPRCAALTHRIAAQDSIAPIWRRNFDHRLSTKWGR